MEKDIKTCIECYDGPESGAPAGNKKGLNIINDINDMYNEQLKKLQDDSESEGALKLQLNTLQDWVCDLMEQNKILVKTIEELEAEALKRHQNTYPVAAPVAAPVGLEEVQQVGSSGLPGPNRKSSEQEETEHTSQQLVEYSATTKKSNDLTLSSEKKYLEEIKNLKQTLENEQNKKMSETRIVAHRSVMTDVYDSGAETFIFELEATKLKLAESERQITQLRTKLTEAEISVCSIRADLCNTEKNARDMRAALTAEVAEKHDQILALKREVAHFEDQLRQADMQTHFKDDIIKKLREDVKVARSKLKFLLSDSDQTATLPPSSEPIVYEANKPDMYKKSCQDDIKVLYPETVHLARKTFAERSVPDSFKSLQHNIATKEHEKLRFRKTKPKTGQQNDVGSVVDKSYRKSKGKLTYTSTPSDELPDVFGTGEPVKMSKEDEACPVHGNVPSWANMYLNHSFH